jgi:hypothetical protein
MNVRNIRLFKELPSNCDNGISFNGR